LGAPGAIGPGHQEEVSEGRELGFEYLTFDCYGTLIDWKTGIAAALGGHLERTDLTPERILTAYLEAEKEEEGAYKLYRQVLRDTAISTAKRLGMRITESGAEEFATSVPSWPVFPDTVKALKSLGKAGYSRHILSNVDTDLLEETIRRNGLEIDGYVTAEEVRSYKPASAHWERFLEKTHSKKSRVLHVAQSVYHDILPTQAIGIASAWVNRYAEALPKRARPLYISDSLENLAALLV
jgi:2-haloacid dehalogenase